MVNVQFSHPNVPFARVGVDFGLLWVGFARWFRTSPAEITTCHTGRYHCGKEICSVGKGQVVLGKVSSAVRAMGSDGPLHHKGDCFRGALTFRRRW